MNTGSVSIKRQLYNTDSLNSDLDAEDIGVIAPYKAQVRAIRELLKPAGLSDVSVGSVEQFQGQVRAMRLFLGRRTLLIHVWPNAGTEGDYFRYHPKQLRGGQAEGNGFLGKPPTNEWCALHFKRLDLMG